jgi:hypothetical protein
VYAGPRLRNAETTSVRRRRPTASSSASSGTAQPAAASRYGTRYAPPPFCPTTAENRQMFPSPTAAPTVTRTNPSPEDHRAVVISSSESESP